MYKIGTVNTTSDNWRLINVIRDNEMNFSTIEVELEYEKGKFIYFIHFDYVLVNDLDINQLIIEQLNKLKNYYNS